MKWVLSPIEFKDHEPVVWEVGYYTPYPESAWKPISKKFYSEEEAEDKCAYLNGKIDFNENELGKVNKVQLSTQDIQIRHKNGCYIYVDFTKAKFLKQKTTYLVEFREITK